MCVYIFETALPVLVYMYGDTTGNQVTQVFDVKCVR